MAQAALDPQDGKYTCNNRIFGFKSNEIVTSIPFCPSGGNLFVVSTENPDVRQANPRKQVLLRQFYFNFLQRKLVHKVSKCKRYPIQYCSMGSVVLLYFSACTGNIIVHFIGEETLSVMMSHGNSNQK